VLVPAYKEDEIILSTAHNLLNLDYPAGFFDVYVIADSFQPETIAQLRNLPLHVLEVSFEKSTKANSLNEAFQRINKNYNIALVCDADNMLEKDFLKKINNQFVDGVTAVQGRRVAKNLDTSFAVLDGCSEAVNNHIFRKGPNALDVSASIIGSGMAFEFQTLKNLMSEIEAVGGFDKMLQLKAVQQGICIHYLEDALIFDEKVDNSNAFKQQRRRWMSSQFIYLRKYFLQGFKELWKGNFNYFNLAVLNNILLPKVFMLVIFPLLVVFTYFIDTDTVPVVILLWILYVVSLAMALPRMLLKANYLFIALRKLPKATLVMFSALFQLKQANKTFIHTVHTKNKITTRPLFNNHGK
jgi:cellulose synthase/poly-beta-1,6-N-acetylglucosamine synthase-like glycosyltransferase